jgi:hypothetical protein
MALVQDGWKVVVTFADQGKAAATTREYGMVSTAYDDIVTDLAAALPTIQAASDCPISSYQVTEVYINDALTLPANIQAENEAFLTVGLAGRPRESGNLSIPGAKIGCFLTTTGGGSDIVDPSDALVSNFVGLFAVGGTLTFSDGEHANASIVKGRRRNVKGKKS